MITTFKNTAETQKILIVVLAILLSTITFETAQQLFYIKRFDLGEASFLGLLKAQTYRWVLWGMLSIFLIRYCKNNASSTKLTLSYLAKYTVLILLLVFANIICISLIQIFINGDVVSFTEVIDNYLVFFTFQKAPIYILGYISITIISHLFFNNEQLNIEIQTLSELKDQNSDLYTELSSTIDDKASILSIKIGNRHKIVPVENIIWIEADGYCVKVHTTTNNTYVMRSSLKALEQKLERNFLRVHRKAIVNMDLVKEVHFSQKPTLILSTEKEISISKSNLKLVKDFIS